MSDDIPSESAKLVPEGHKWCFDCEGLGKSPQVRNNVPSCKVCKGKGYWNIADMQDYHKKYPEICDTNTKFCALCHIEPLYDLIILPLNKAMETLKEVDAFLEKHRNK